MRPKVTRFTLPPSDLSTGIAVTTVSSSLKFSLSSSEFRKKLCVYLVESNVCYFPKMTLEIKVPMCHI
jgi:hypothetical protein